MSVAAARRTVVFNNPVVDSATAPVNPVDGMLWRNTTNNVLSVYRASPPAGWQVVSDNLGVQNSLQGLTDGTLENDSFNALMGAVTALVGPILPDGTTGPGGLASAANMALVANLAASLSFSGSGLTISNQGGDVWTRLALEQLEFWKGKDAAAVMMAVFGVLKTITSPTLQIGSSSQSPKLQLGEGILEYQAATGNITCRKA